MHYSRYLGHASALATSLARRKKKEYGLGSTSLFICSILMYPTSATVTFGVAHRNFKPSRKFVAATSYIMYFIYARDVLKPQGVVNSETEFFRVNRCSNAGICTISLQVTTAIMTHCVARAVWSIVWCLTKFTNHRIPPIELSSSVSRIPFFHIPFSLGILRARFGMGGWQRVCRCILRYVPGCQWAGCCGGIMRAARSTM